MEAFIFSHSDAWHSNESLPTCHYSSGCVWEAMLLQKNILTYFEVNIQANDLEVECYLEPAARVCSKTNFLFVLTQIANCECGLRMAN